MNSTSYLRNLGLIVAIFALACLPAFAGHSHTFQTKASVMTPDGTQIPAGVYQVNCQSHSPTATVTFKQDKKVVATIEGHWVERGENFEDDSIVYQQNADGMPTLTEIRFAGRNQALVIGN